jgi:hypothetical protein
MRNIYFKLLIYLIFLIIISSFSFACIDLRGGRDGRLCDKYGSRYEGNNLLIFGNNGNAHWFYNGFGKNYEVIVPHGSSIIVQFGQNHLIILARNEVHLKYVDGQTKYYVLTNPGQTRIYTNTRLPLGVDGVSIGSQNNQFLEFRNVSAIAMFNDLLFNVDIRGYLQYEKNSLNSDLFLDSLENNDKFYLWNDYDELYNIKFLNNKPIISRCINEIKNCNGFIDLRIRNYAINQFLGYNTNLNNLFNNKDIAKIINNEVNNEVVESFKY